MKKVLLEHKPNYMITVPAHWEYFIKEDFKNCDLSFIKKIIVGGDTMSASYKNKLKSIFSDHGAENPLLFGYGLSETTSTAVVNFCAPENSIGNALPNIQIAICDPQTNETLPNNIEGEICICGPTVCMGYFNDKEMTDELLQIHKDGKLWLHSGDRGYIDENQAIYFCERYKRMYVRFDGTKISPYSIEQVLSKCSIIEACLVIAIKDTAHSHGKCAKANIVLKNGVNKKQALPIIKDFCKKNLDEHMQPQKIVFVDSLPKTANGKIDYFEKNLNVL